MRKLCENNAISLPYEWQIKNYWVLIISKIAGYAEKYADVKQCFIFPNVFSLKYFPFHKYFSSCDTACAQKYVHIFM